MRIQSKSASGDSQPLRAATAKPAGQLFGDVLAESAKAKQQVATADSLARVVSTKEQSEECARRQSSEQTQAIKEQNGTESTGRGSRTGRASGQRARIAQSHRELHKQSMSAEGDDEAPESITATHTDDDHGTASEGDKSAQEIVQQSNVTGVPASSAIEVSSSEQGNDETANGASAITPIENNAQAVDPSQGNAGTSATMAGAAERSNGAQRGNQSVSGQQDTEAEAAGGEDQDADATAQSAGIGASNPDLDANFEALAFPAAAGLDSVQTLNVTNDAGSKKLGSVESGSSGSVLANAAQSAMPDLTASQDGVIGVQASSGVQATGNFTGNLHSNGNGSQSTDQTTHHAETDLSQSGATASHTEMASLLQTATAQHVESRSTSSAHASNVEMTAQTISASGESLVDQTSGSAQAGMSGISTARLIQTMTDSEMRVGIHSAEFGAISIRTTVTAQQMQAQIAVGHSDLGTAIATHIPSIQAKLGSDYGLQASISVNANCSGFSDGGQYQAQRQSAAPSLEGGELQDAASDVPVALVSAVTSSGNRLDIRA